MPWGPAIRPTRSNPLSGHPQAAVIGLARPLMLYKRLTTSLGSAISPKSCELILSRGIFFFRLERLL